MKRTKNGYTPKQYAYAKRKLGGQGKSKKEMALLSGFAPSVASSVSSHIEKTEGFNNAMADLAEESGNMVMKIYHALSSKDLTKESVPVLLQAVQTMASAWETFTPKAKANENNPLRAVLLQHVENQTINNKKK